MRAAFGLVSILVVVGIIALLWSQYNPVVVEEGRKAEDKMEQIAGKGAATSIKLEPRHDDGKLRALHVDEIEADGPMAKYFGLRRDDLIVKITSQDFTQKVAELGFDEAKARVLEAYQRSGSLTILRGGKELVLPEPGSSPQRGGQSNTGNSGIDRQLDAIRSPR